MLILLFSLLLLARAAAADQDLEARTRAARLRVQAYLATGEWAKAADELGRLADRFPQNRYILGDLAGAYQRQGETGRAVEIYRRLLDIHPEAAVYRRDLAYLLSEAGRYGEVLDLFAEIRRSPQDADSDLIELLAQTCDRAGRRAEADSLYETLRQRHPDDPTLLLAMGERYLGQQRPEEALVFFRQVHAIEPRNPRILKGMALALGPERRAQYREYLLPVLVLDKQDAEVPYLLGEFYFADDPEKAGRYFQEALKRLQKKDATSPYEQSMEARLHYRLGRRIRAESLFRKLLEQRPGDIDLKNDLAEMLITDGRDNAALELLPPGAGDSRSAQLRVTVYLQRRWWSEAAGELSLLVAQSPSDENLKLDLAETLERSGDWPAALDLHDEILRRKRSRTTTERAYEMRRQLRTRRGLHLGLQLDHTSLTGEDSFGLRPSLRWQVSPRLHGVFHGSVHRRADRTIADHPDFSKRVGDYGLVLGYALRPGWEVEAHARGHLWHLEGRPNFGAATRYYPGRGGVVEASGSANDVWSEPVNAILYKGLFNQARLSFYLPFAGRWAVQGQARWRSLRLHRTQYFGSERRGGIVLSREILRRPYGASFPLRSLNLSVAHERTWSSQEEAFLELIRLLDKTSATSVELLVHFLFRQRSSLDLAVFAGRDPERDLAPGELLGLSFRFHADLSSDFALYASSFFSSESSVEATGGSYRQARVGLIYYFKKNIRHLQVPAGSTNGPSPPALQTSRQLLPRSNRGRI